MAGLSRNPPKLYLNEHLSPELARALRQHGFDVTSCLEVDMGETEDTEQLAYAVSQQRALLTFNSRHFSVLHVQYLEEGKEHWRIVLSTQEPFKILLQRLLRLLHSLTAEELKSQLRWVNEFK